MSRSAKFPGFGYAPPDGAASGTPAGSFRSLVGAEPDVAVFVLQHAHGIGAGFFVGWENVLDEEGDPIKCAVIVRISDAGEFEFYKSVCP